MMFLIYNLLYFLDPSPSQQFQVIVNMTKKMLNNL